MKTFVAMVKQFEHDRGTPLSVSSAAGWSPEQFASDAAQTQVAAKTFGLSPLDTLAFVERMRKLGWTIELDSTYTDLIVKLF